MSDQIVAGSNVQHPLYPELGVGQVLVVSVSSAPVAKVHWPDADQTSTHSVKVLREPGARPADAREAIARVAGMCSYSARHAAPHDHSQCLIEADELLSMLLIAGYRVIGTAELADIQGIAV